MGGGPVVGEDGPAQHGGHTEVVRALVEGQRARRADACVVVAEPAGEGGPAHTLARGEGDMQDSDDDGRECCAHGIRVSLIRVAGERLAEYRTRVVHS